MANNAFGIDLGTNNIKIYNRNDDNIMIEKNMIAIENKNTLFAYGNSAFEMYEKAPSNIHISYPLSNGVIADIKNMETLVKYFIGDLQKGNTKPSDFFIAVPTDVTEVEKRAFYDLVKGANVKAKKIMVVEKAVADGLGLDIDVKNSQGVLVVNVGYETTEISILSLGGIVLSRLIKVGGMKFDDAIRAAVRREFSLIIGGKTAENVKIALKELEEEGKGAIVYGRDIVTGHPAGCDPLPLRRAGVPEGAGQDRPVLQCAAGAGHLQRDRPHPLRSAADAGGGRVGKSGVRGIGTSLQ